MFRGLSHKTYPRAGRTAAMLVEIDPEQLIEKSTDERGRLTLGTDWADTEVRILVEEV